MKSVAFYVYGGKAYFPVQAEAEGGVLLDTEPVRITHLEIQELGEAILSRLQEGHPRIASPSSEEMKEHARVALRATKARSWKKLSRDGATYDIGWEGNKVLLTMYRPDKKGRWVPDPARSRQFPTDAPLRDLVQVILNDISTRPELLSTQ